MDFSQAAPRIPDSVVSHVGDKVSIPSHSQSNNMASLPKLESDRGPATTTLVVLTVAAALLAFSVLG